MAIRKMRLIRENLDKSQDTIHLETSAECILYTGTDGTKLPLDQVLNKVDEDIKKIDDKVEDVKDSIGSTDPPVVPDPEDPDPGKEPGGDDIDDPPNNDGTIDGYAPGQSVDFVPTVGDGLTGHCSGYYYFVFEKPDFTNNMIRIPASLHKMSPQTTSAIYTLRNRLNRTAVDYHSDTPLSTIRDLLIDCQRQGLARYASGEHDDFPMDTDGNVIMTWEQVQVFLLEGTLKTRTEARNYCLSKDINWKNIPTYDVTTTVTIEDLMSACFIPATTAGASTALIDGILTLDVIHALHLRHRDDGVGVQDKYNLFGRMMPGTWNSQQTQVYWDLKTLELVIEAESPFPGDILVIG